MGGADAANFHGQPALFQVEETTCAVTGGAAQLKWRQCFTLPNGKLVLFNEADSHLHVNLLLPYYFLR
jgi:hypothetical protein